MAVRVTPEGLILVDSKFRENVADILEKVRSVSSLPVKYLLNTHHHLDHAGGDAVFIDTTEIIAHRNVRENFLRNRQPGAPRVTFTDQASVFLGGVEVRAYYFGRAHTNGDTVIYFPDLREIHTGDLITEGMPVMDYNNGASAVEWVKVLDEILKLDFDVVSSPATGSSSPGARPLGPAEARDAESADGGAGAQGRPARAGVRLVEAGRSRVGSHG